MAITQTDFDQYADIGYHGQLNTDFPMWIESPIAAGSYIGFGVAVVAGDLENTAVVAGAGTTSADIIGFTVRNHAVAANFSATPYNYATQTSGFEEGRPMSVLTMGRMYVRVEEEVVRGDAVYVVAGTGEVTATALDNVEVVGAKFVRSAGAGEISEIQIK